MERGRDWVGWVGAVGVYGFCESDRNGDVNGYVLESNLRSAIVTNERHDSVFEN